MVNLSVKKKRYPAAVFQLAGNWIDTRLDAHPAGHFQVPWRSKAKQRKVFRMIHGSRISQLPMGKNLVQMDFLGARSNGFKMFQTYLEVERKHHPSIAQMNFPSTQQTPPNHPKSQRSGSPFHTRLEGNLLLQIDDDQLVGIAFDASEMLSFALFAASGPSHVL